MNLKGYIDSSDPKLTQGAKDRLKDLTQQWNSFNTERNAIISQEMNAYNTLYQSLGLPAIILKEADK